MTRFNGPEYQTTEDHKRLSSQIARIFDCMIDGQWRTFKEIHQITGDPEASISAQLRHLRKERFGSYTVERRARGDREQGLFEYRLLAIKTKPEPKQENTSPQERHVLFKTGPIDWKEPRCLIFETREAADRYKKDNSIGGAVHLAKVIK
jgi:hypothetical protein